MKLRIVFTVFLGPRDTLDDPQPIRIVNWKETEYRNKQAGRYLSARKEPPHFLPYESRQQSIHPSPQRATPTNHYEAPS